MNTVFVEATTATLVPAPPKFATKRTKATLGSFSSSLEEQIAQALARSRDLTAVERFSQWHREEIAHAHGAFYKDMLPASPPAPGQQYAFEVDLDKCSSCKVCVVACHSLNGLDEGESWRSVDPWSDRRSGSRSRRPATTVWIRVAPAAVPPWPTRRTS
ncbi:MAG: hypothetical protein IPN71_09930 [Fibrobacteres bacterium]|nr:hypothetical protein [Fibrobacterota bacterium]